MENLKKTYREIYNQEPMVSFYAPCCVNIIGEHIDYNGGQTLSFAMNRGITALIGTREDTILSFASTSFDSILLMDFKNHEALSTAWNKYAYGVVSQVLNMWIEYIGVNTLVHGDLPMHKGLSTSAAVEVMTAYAINIVRGCNFTMTELVDMCYCSDINNLSFDKGFVSQYTACFAKANTALLINSQNRTHKNINLELTVYKFIITNSNKEIDNSNPIYRERRKESEDLLQIIKSKKKYKSICEVSCKQAEKLRLIIPSEKLFKRLRHIVSENERVIMSTNAILDNNLIYLGKMMNDSHESLKNDYEITGYELDILVDEARKIEGVLGSKMTGSGLGGCTITLIHKDSIEEFKEKVGQAYFEKTHIYADFYLTELCDGVREIEI